MEKRKKEYKRWRHNSSLLEDSFTVQQLNNYLTKQ